MIQSLRRTEWITLVKVTGYIPTQICSERLRYLSTVDKSEKPSISLSSLIDTARECDVERWKSSDKPKLVLEFLKGCGFSESQIKLVVMRWPGILVSNPGKTLKPKIDFLLSKGLSKSNLMRLLSDEPKSLARSLEKHMIPLFDFLKSIVGSEENVVRALHNYPYIFRISSRKYLELNTLQLQNSGVPKSEIAKLIMNRFRAIVPKPLRFNKALTTVKEMGFDPTEPTFGHAVAAIGWCSQSAWEGKMEMFRSYGLSDSEILVGFKKIPVIMMLTEANMRAKMNFFIKEMHWCPHKVIMAPHVLVVSLEKRTIPRLSVLYVLASKGKVKEKEITSVVSFLKLAENKFVQKYITAYKDNIPQVVNAHRGELKIQDLRTLNSTVLRPDEYCLG